MPSTTTISFDSIMVKTGKYMSEPHTPSKVIAIKAIREVFGFGLKSAKDFVEAHMEFNVDYSSTFHVRTITSFKFKMKREFAEELAEELSQYKTCELNYAHIKNITVVTEY